MNYEIKISAKNLPVMDIGGSSDPYFKVFVDDIERYKSKAIKNELNPSWDTFKINMQAWEECGAGNWLAFNDGKSCNVSISSMLRFEVFDKDLLKDDFMGLATLNVTDLTSSDHKDLQLTDRKGTVDKGCLKIRIANSY